MSRRANSASLGKEIATLYSLGLETDEIKYIIYMKSKMLRAKKWG